MHGVQAHGHHCGCDAHHSPVASHLCGTVAKDIAGFLRIQEADRLSGMGDFVRYRLCFRLFGHRPDPLNVEMMLHQSLIARTRIDNKGSQLIPCLSSPVSLSA
jgi:hypothetical protein